MKKVVSMLLMLCLLAGMTALAAESSVWGSSIVVQNDAAATIYDANGAAIATVPNHGELELTLMENRKNAAADVYNRLQWAYEAVHATDHLEDLAVADPAGKVGMEINRVLQDMGSALDVYDMFVYDSFELTLNEAYANQLGNGNTLQVSFDTGIDRAATMVVLVSNDMASWDCLEADQVNLAADGVATVEFDAVGTVLFLIDREIRQPEGQPSDSDFVKSIGSKPAPGIIPPTNSIDGSIVANIYDETNVLVSSVPNDGSLVITAVSERGACEDKQVRERLEWAYEEIRNTTRLGNLKGENGAIAGDIDNVLAATGFADLSSDDMIVRDLFDATLYDSYVDDLNDEGHYIEITFDLKLKKDDPLVILVTNDNETWQVVEAADFQINADGSVTMRLEELGTIAILVDAAEQEINRDDAVKSPKTGE